MGKKFTGKLYSITLNFARRSDAERYIKRNMPNFNYKNKWNIGYCETNFHGDDD